MVNKIKIFVLFFFGVSFLLNAQTITVEASTDTTDYLIGDYINYQLVISYNKNYRIIKPVLKDKLGTLEIIKEGNVDVSENGSKVTEVYHYILAGYDSAKINIPPIKIEYRVNNNSDVQSITSNPVPITIHTLNVNPKADIKDVKQPLRIPVNWLIYLLIAVIILIILLIAYYIYSKKKKQTEPEQVVKKVEISPYRQTLNALAELEEKKLWQKGEIKQYHSELTGIIRKYFEYRYNFNALEMTSSEIMKVLDRVMDNQQLIDTAKEFFRNADLVKFAKFVPMPSINEEMMKQAYTIVKRTRPAEHYEENYEGANVQ